MRRLWNNREAISYVLLIAAVVVVPLMLVANHGNGDDARSQATISQQESAAVIEQRERSVDQAKAAAKRKAARERAAIRDAEDRVNADRVLSDWQDDVWFPDEVWRVKVRGGAVTVDSKSDPGQEGKVMVGVLCRETLARYDWARSVRVTFRGGSGAGDVGARC